MKKVFSIIAVAALATSFVACGPSAEEKAKMEAEQRVADSIKADSVAKALASSLEAAMTSEVPDSTAATTETAAPAADAHAGH